ncbi:amidase [Agaricicola taiwanensis]|uniref:Amidase n=1 Tax=Agaricicola taiwanensis TaxID=591372 RepID=A0A8J2VMD7_9RHOB|nr:amidase [Agaricicola taiwanensis]GGE31923.1 amidase [Agaricicola taiwanensis]
MTDICWLSAADLAAAYRRRELSPVTVVEHLLARIRALNPTLNVFIHVDEEGALRQARQAEADLAAGRDLGSLHGIPYGVKDIIDVKGLPTTCHSAVLKDNVATRDAVVVDRLRKAGAIPLGKISTHEFAIGGPSFDLPFPPARNPWNLDHHPGGSSSGSGAGVAAGLFPVALGTDTGGSVRNPAGACGVMGLKASYDKVSRDGVFPLSWTLDYVGPLARKAEDVALFLGAMTGSPPPALNPDIRGLRVGFVRHYHEKEIPAGPETAAALQTAADTLAGLGATVTDVELPSLIDFANVNRAILTPEAWAIHGQWMREHPEKYGRFSRRRLMVGAFVSAEAHVRARLMGARLKEKVEAVFDKVDVLLLANAMNPPCRIEDEEAVALNYFQHARAPFNLTGHPAMSVMCGLSASGLPLAMQIAGPQNREDVVLNVAAAYQKATDWTDRHPPLTAN